MNLFKEFSASSQEEWEQKILQDLKGKPFDTVIWKSEIGEVNPVLFSTEIEQKALGIFPYTRGNKVYGNNWDIRQEFDASETEANRDILEALKGGVNSIELYNIAPDIDLEKLFSNVQLDIIKIYFHIDSKNGKDVIKKLKEYCGKNGINTEVLEGGFLFDPVRELAITGQLKFDESIVKTLQETSALFPKFVTFGIDAGIYAEAGANIPTQLSSALSHGHEYLVQRLKSGEKLEDIVNTMEFSFSVGTSYFLEIAKFRAFRTLWATIVSEYAEGEFDFEIKIKAKTSNLYYSLKDKYNNLLRATTSGMSAVIAGVDSLVVLPFDINEQRENKSFGYRLAKNIQLLLQEESYMKQVADASGGAYYIEELTQKIEEKSWELFQDIENKEGGIMESLIQGNLQERIKEQFNQKSEELKQQKRIMVGVNKFENKDEKTGIPLGEKVSVSNGLLEPLQPKRLAFDFE